MQEAWSWGHVVEKAGDGLGAFIRLCNIRFKRLEILLNQLRGAVFGPPVVYVHLMPGADWGLKVEAAIGQLPATGGIVDARGLTGAQSLSANCDFTLANTKILCGPMDLAMGAFSIVKASGVHQVDLIGHGPWGHAGTNAAASGGTRFHYTGTGDAIQWGDASGDSYKCNITDIGVNIGSAGTAARGVVAKRLIVGTLARIHIGGLSSASTQKLMVLDGTNNYCGHVLIEQPYLQNGNVGLYFTGSGVNGPNGCTVTRAIVNGVSTGTGFLQDAGAENLLEGDFENWGTAIDLRRSTLYGVLRFEGNTTDISCSAASSFNRVYCVSGSSGSTAPVVSDSGSLNRIESPTWHAFQRDLILFRNLADASVSLILQPGSSAEQTGELIFRNRSGTNKWRFQKNSSDNFNVLDVANSINRFSAVASSGNTQFNAAGTGAVQINAEPNHGTGGLQVFDGGASPAEVFAVDNAGNMVADGDLTAAGGFRQTVDGWYQDNVTASQTDVELTRAVGRFRTVRAGSVTGVIVTSTEARTAGTLTVTVFKNTGLAGATGSTIGLTAVLDGTNTSRKATTQAKDTDTFAAGDELYAVVTTDGSWTPTTADIRVAIEIED